MKSTTFNFSQLKESAVMALGAIRANKLRASLTLLGVAVGVFSIIAVMTAMEVLRSSIEVGLAGLGANTFQLQKWNVAFNSTPQQRRKWRNRKNITLHTMSAIASRSQMPSGWNAAPAGKLFGGVG
jgi:putative ABC transport system permease protein